MNAAAEEQSVLAIEDAYVRAEVSRDEVELRRLVDDFNRSNGTTWGKEELIAGVLGMHMTGQTVRERRVLIEGDVALVFGTADLRTADAAGQESETALRYTATYVRREGSWRMLALQMQQRAKD